MTPDSLDIWAPSGEHIVVAWHWQFERLLRETKKKTLNKADEHASISLWCRLTDSPSTHPRNHHASTIPWNLHLELAPCMLVQKTVLQTQVGNLEWKIIKMKLKLPQIIGHFQSSGTQQSLQSLQNISKNCWKEQIWTHASFLHVTMPNCQLRWPKFIKEEFKCPSTLFSLPESVVGNLPVTILLELSFKVKNKQTNKPNMCYLLGRLLQISGY